MLLYSNVLEAFFIGHRDSCVRDLLAMLTQVFFFFFFFFFSPVKACFCVNTAGQLLLFLL